MGLSNTCSFELMYNFIFLANDNALSLSYYGMRCVQMFLLHIIKKDIYTKKLDACGCICVSLLRVSKTIRHNLFGSIIVVMEDDTYIYMYISSCHTIIQHLNFLLFITIVAAIENIRSFLQLLYWLRKPWNLVKSIGDVLLCEKAQLSDVLFACSCYLLTGLHQQIISSPLFMVDG